MFHRHISRRSALAVTLLAAGILAVQATVAHATVTQFVTTNGQQNCPPTNVTTDSNGNAVTTWGPCGITTLSNVSPAYPQPDAGTFTLQARPGSGLGQPCSSGSAFFSGPSTGNSTVDGQIGYEYRDELGTLTWSGSIAYGQNAAGDCETNYAAGGTTPLRVTGTGFYVNMQELCEFDAVGPDSPALTLGPFGGTISFDVDSNAPGTGCTRSN